MFVCTTHWLPHLCVSPTPPPAPLSPRAAGLRPRGDEPDQSDQSTEITVIPEVRRRAPGHSEFTHPTQAPDKSVQEWQTFGLKKLRFDVKNEYFTLYFRNWWFKQRSELWSAASDLFDLFPPPTRGGDIANENTFICIYIFFLIADGVDEVT